jgi:hypothetical protein
LTDIAIFEFLMVVKIQVVIFWVMTPYSVAVEYVQNVGILTTTLQGITTQKTST